MAHGELLPSLIGVRFGLCLVTLTLALIGGDLSCANKISCPGEIRGQSSGIGVIFLPQKELQQFIWKGTGTSYGEQINSVQFVKPVSTMYRENINQTVPRENDSRMNDWIRNRIIFRLFYSIYKKDTKFLRNLMRAIHEIAREIIILNSTGLIQNKLLTSVAISNQTYSSNRSAKRVSRSDSKILRVSYVQRKVQNAFDPCL